MLLWRSVGLFLFYIIFYTSAEAGVIIDRTRLIVQEGDRESEVMLVNKNNYKTLVQAWIDDGDIDNDPATVNSSFIVLPPVFALSADRLQGLRVIPVNNGNFSKDRETLFWLNVLEMPPQERNGAEEPRLVITFRTQIKVLFRPKGLAYDLSKAVSNVRFNKVPDGFLVKNSSPYHISFASMAFKRVDGETKHSLSMLEPFSDVLLNVNDTSSYDEVVFFWIDDYGNAHEKTVRLE